LYVCLPATLESHFKPQAAYQVQVGSQGVQFRSH
jgi:hypothetical protein